MATEKYGEKNDLYNVDIYFADINLSGASFTFRVNEHWLWYFLYIMHKVVNNNECSTFFICSSEWIAIMAKRQGNRVSSWKL